MEECLDETSLAMMEYCDNEELDEINKQNLEEEMIQV